MSDLEPGNPFIQHDYPVILQTETFDTYSNDYGHVHINRNRPGLETTIPGCITQQGPHNKTPKKLMLRITDPNTGKDVSEDIIPCTKKSLSDKQSVPSHPVNPIAKEFAAMVAAKLSPTISNSTNTKCQPKQRNHNQSPDSQQQSTYSRSQLNINATSFTASDNTQSIPVNLPRTPESIVNEFVVNVAAKLSPTISNNTQSTTIPKSQAGKNQKVEEFAAKVADKLSTSKSCNASSNQDLEHNQIPVNLPRTPESIANEFAVKVAAKLSPTISNITNTSCKPNYREANQSPDPQQLSIYNGPQLNINANSFTASNNTQSTMIPKSQSGKNQIAEEFAAKVADKLSTSKSCNASSNPDLEHNQIPVNLPRTPESIANEFAVNVAAKLSPTLSNCTNTDCQPNYREPNQSPDPQQLSIYNGPQLNINATSFTASNNTHSTTIPKSQALKKQIAEEFAVKVAAAQLSSAISNNTNTNCQPKHKQPESRSDPQQQSNYNISQFNINDTSSTASNGEQHTPIPKLQAGKNQIVKEFATKVAAKLSPTISNNAITNCQPKHWQQHVEPISGPKQQSTCKRLQLNINAASFTSSNDVQSIPIPKSQAGKNQIAEEFASKVAAKLSTSRSCDASSKPLLEQTQSKPGSDLNEDTHEVSTPPVKQDITSNIDNTSTIKCPVKGNDDKSQATVNIPNDNPTPRNVDQSPNSQQLSIYNGPQLNINATSFTASNNTKSNSVPKSQSGKNQVVEEFVVNVADKRSTNKSCNASSNQDLEHYQIMIPKSQAVKNQIAEEFAAKVAAAKSSSAISNNTSTNCQPKYKQPESRSDPQQQSNYNISQFSINDNSPAASNGEQRTPIPKLQACQPKHWQQHVEPISGPKQQSTRKRLQLNINAASFTSSNDVQSTPIPKSQAGKNQIAEEFASKVAAKLSTSMSCDASSKPLLEQKQSRPGSDLNEDVHVVWTPPVKQDITSNIDNTSTIKFSVKGNDDKSQATVNMPNDNPTPRNIDQQRESDDTSALNNKDMLSCSSDLNVSNGNTPMSETQANGGLRKINDNIYYDIDSELGRGATSVVFKGTFMGSHTNKKGFPIAVKRIIRKNKHDAKELDREMKHIYRELENLDKLESRRHKHIVGYYGSKVEADKLFIAFEFCHGTLSDYVNDGKLAYLRNSLRPVEVHKGMASGLGYMHAHGIAHRDLKPANIFFVIDLDNDYAKVVVGDFGSAKTVVESVVSHTGGSGTLGYIAPETYHAICNSNSHTMNGIPAKKSDIFSLGLLYNFCVTSGKHPYGDNQMECQKNISDRNPPKFDGLEKEHYALQKLMENMLANDPTDRPNAKYVENHPALWEPKRILDYFVDRSDTFEAYIKSNPGLNAMLEDTYLIPNGNWERNLPKKLKHHLKRHKYNDKRLYEGKGNSARSFLRAIRNINSHYKDFPEDVRAELGSYPDGHVDLWLNLCPKILLHVYTVLDGIHRC